MQRLFQELVKLEKIIELLKARVEALENGTFVPRSESLLSQVDTN
jgi:hypothetical protein